MVRINRAEAANDLEMIMKKFEVEQLTPFFLLSAMYLGSYVIALPLAAKIIALGPIIVPGGYIAASVTYPCTDIVDEVYGKELANKMVTMTLLAMLVVFVLIVIDGSLPSAPNWELEQSYNDIFGFTPRLMIAGIVAFVLGQYTDVYLFDEIRKRTGGKYLWLRNNLSTAISKLLDAVSFNYIAFYGVIHGDELLSMTVCTYLFYLLIALLDTPLVYTGVYFVKKHIERFDNKDSEIYSGQLFLG